MQTINTDKPALRKFGITMAIALMVITTITVLRHKHSATPITTAAIIFLIAAWAIPAVLRPFYIAWMRLGFILSWINTRLILILAFYLLISPVALMMKLFGADLLDQRINRTKKTYWLLKEKSQQAAQNYERRF
jgi:hypothetical protein